MVEFKQPAQALGLGDRTFFLGQPFIRKRNEIIETLVVSFSLMMLQIFLERIGQRPLPKKNQLRKALGFDGTDPAFSISIQVGTSGR